MLITLRPVLETDLPIFFAFHQDEGALWMAAFTPPDPTDEAALTAHWRRLAADPRYLYTTIEADGEVAGSLVFFEMFGQQQVGYWLGRDYWGRGIATEALRQYLTLIADRPLYARTAFDNAGSQRVLQKNGFRLYGTDRGYANARGEEIEEWVWRLE